MKKSTLSFAAFLMITVLSCKQKNEKNNDNVGLDNTSLLTKKNETICYSYIKNNDTITLSIDGIDNTMIEELTYNLYQKDKNVGIFEGQMSGDTLIGTYNFISEGQESKREIVFLKTNEGLVEGMGNVEEKNNMMVFENRSKLNFSSGLILKEVNCN